MPLDFTQIYPATVLNGITDSGSSLGPWTPPDAEFGFLLLGIDAYPQTQPNNGDFIAEMSLGFSVTYIVFQVQQSANFPGPFSWRGCIPMYHNAMELSIGSSVGFASNAWGFFLPYWQSDYIPPT